MKSSLSCICCEKPLYSRCITNIIDADGNPVTDYSIKICTNCGSGITNPFPSDEIIKASYSQGVYTKRGGRLRYVFNKVLDWLQEERLKGISQYHPKKGDILDIGCGKGRFLRKAKELGWNVHGQDLADGQVEAAMMNGECPVWSGELKQAKFKSKSFQAVSAWHVIEHIQDVSSLLDEISRVLSDDGILALEVPNFSSLQAKIGGGKWFQADVPRHLYHFTTDVEL